MSFFGKAGFFGPLKPYTGPYHPSVYKRGGGMAAGTLGKAFAYKRPQLANGGMPTEDYARGGNVYAKQPPNGPRANDPGSGHTAARGGGDYSWGKKTSRNNYAAQINPTGHGETKRRAGTVNDDYLSPAQRRAYESHERFRRGGAAKVAPWTDRPPHIKQRLARGSGAPKIHVPHDGGLVLSIHLSDVGPHAITLGHSGGVDTSRMVQRQASHALQHPTLVFSGERPL